MSNSLAIAAITSTLQGILQRSLLTDLPPAPDLNIGNPPVTTAPLDRARKNRDNTHQLNLYLYEVVPSPQLRNLDVGGQRSPIALELHYLLTAFAGGDDDRPAHLLLGQAMRILLDHAVLGSDELRLAFKGNDVAEQLDSVRITPRSLTIEDQARLWSMAQTQARLSVAYTASVVLIDSAAPRRAPLPVLRRGAADLGLQLVLSPEFTGPLVDDLIVPQSRKFALPGDPLIVVGQQLRAAEVRVRLTHPRLAAPIDLTPANTSTPSRLTVTLPVNPAQLPAGIYGLTVVLRDPGNQRTTGSFALPVAPEISTTPLPALKRNPQGVASLTLDFRPAALPDQQVALIVGDREVPAPQRNTATQRLTFAIPGPAGDFLLRLRVDGVDSDIIDRNATPPAFNLTRRISITS